MVAKTTDCGACLSTLTKELFSRGAKLYNKSSLHALYAGVAFFSYHKHTASNKNEVLYSRPVSLLCTLPYLCCFPLLLHR